MNPSQQCQHARALAAQGRSDEALRLYDRVIESFPDHAPAYADRGTTYAMTGAHARALEDLERAMAMGLRDGWLLTTYASVLLALRRFDESLRYFDLAIALEPGHPFAYNNRATLHIERGDLSAAIADLERCLGFGPDEATRQMLERRLQSVRAALARQ